MKVWEKCNELKGTDATKELIAQWAYMNRVCPVMFDNELDLEDGVKYPKQMEELAYKYCHDENIKCGTDCLDVFLKSEVAEESANDKP